MWYIINISHSVVSFLNHINLAQPGIIFSCTKYSLKTLKLTNRYVTEYDEWDHIVRIAMLGLFQDVMRNRRSSASATLGTDVTLNTTSSLQFFPSHIGHTLI